MLRCCTRKVLLVEDDAMTRRVMSNLLRREGFDVTPLESYETAMEAARQQKFDLLLSDINLPGRSGWDLVHDLQALYAIPAIALSALGESPDLDRSFSAGFSVHLTKPATLEQVLMAMEQVLAKQDPPAAQLVTPTVDAA